jgi:hypothetical protein
LGELAIGMGELGNWENWETGNLGEPGELGNWENWETGASGKLGELGSQEIGNPSH